MTSPSPFDQMRLVGATALAFSREWFDNPTYASDRFTEFMCANSQVHPNDLPENIYQSLCCNSLIAGRWAMSGFPTVTLGHRAAAQFMAMKIRPDDAREFVRSPWPAFGIR